MGNDLSTELAAFLRDRAALRTKYGSKWVAYRGAEFVGAFDDYGLAFLTTAERFPGEIFMVRRITAEDEQVPLVFADEV